MPRTNNRKRNHCNENSNRVSVASTLSPNAPEFIPPTNDESTTNQGECLPIQSMSFYGSSSASNSSGNDNNDHTYNSEATNTTPAPDPLADKGQRDLLIALLNSAKVDCVICYENAKNIEPIWNCRNCFQIMHLRCVMVWFIKSNDSAAWRCPACQNRVVGKPNYYCFCGTLPNPYSNNVDTPHSCGQVCGLTKKNSNTEYSDCHHKCTLLCHPGPCPQCVVQVLRQCCCKKTQVHVRCGQTAPILCQNICSKELNCRNHVCEKQCHIGQCEPCKKDCHQNGRLYIRSLSSLRDPPGRRSEARRYVSEDELRALGLNPAELFSNEDSPNNMDYHIHDHDHDFEDIGSADDDDISDGTAARFFSLLEGANSNYLQPIIPSSPRLNRHLAQILSGNINRNSFSNTSSSSSSSSSNINTGFFDNDDDDDDVDEGRRSNINAAPTDADIQSAIASFYNEQSDNEMEVSQREPVERGQRARSWANIFGGFAFDGHESESSSSNLSDTSFNRSVSSISSIEDLNSYSSSSDSSSSY